MITETINRMQDHDPAQGGWYTDRKEMNVWVDAISLVVEVNKLAIEDVCWLHPPKDMQHIQCGRASCSTEGNQPSDKMQMRDIYLNTDYCVYHLVSNILRSEVFG